MSFLVLRHSLISLHKYCHRINLAKCTQNVNGVVEIWKGTEYVALAMGYSRVRILAKHNISGHWWIAGILTTVCDIAWMRHFIGRILYKTILRYLLQSKTFVSWIRWWSWHYQCYWVVMVEWLWWGFPIKCREFLVSSIAIMPPL